MFDVFNMKLLKHSENLNCNLPKPMMLIKYYFIGNILARPYVWIKDSR